MKILEILDKFKKGYVVGLDLGSSAVKMAQFAEKEGGFYLVRADLREFKPSEGAALNEEAVVSALGSLLKGIDVKRSRIIANINCPQTAIKKVLAPYMPKAELKEGLELEAKNYFPFPVDESSLDFEILGDVVEKGVRKYEVLVAVSPKKTVDRYMSLLEKAGLRPDSIIPSSYALQKVAGYSHYGEDKTRCFIDIGAFYTELVILNEKRPVLFRKIPIAGMDFTRTMTGTLLSDRGRTQLSIEEAERIKREVGRPAATDSTLIDGKISAAQILSMLRPTAEQLASEIERCFDYYREESGGGKIDCITLFGGGSAPGRLIGYLSDNLGTEVKLGDAIEGLTVEREAVPGREKLGYRLDLAVGAALSQAKGINLLPAEVKEKTKRVFKRGTIEGIATAVILILALVYIGMGIQLGNYQKRVAVAGLELSGLQNQLKKVEAQVIINKMLMDEPQWEEIFKELSNIIPDKIHIANIKMENNIITMKGVAAPPEGNQVLAAFMLTLENGLFDNVRLVESKKLGAAGGVEFELKCWVDYESG
jgi:type IV pilus assembly protein PilM